MKKKDRLHVSFLDKFSIAGALFSSILILYAGLKYCMDTVGLAITCMIVSLILLVEAFQQIFDVISDLLKAVVDKFNNKVIIDKSDTDEKYYDEIKETK